MLKRKRVETAQSDSKQPTACYLLPIAYGLLFTYCLLSSCSTRDAKFQQYYVQGEQLYVRNCSNCHQKSGKGLGRVYPPLAPSDYMEANFEAVLCQMKYGKKGSITVNGNEFNQPMPGVRSLTELEIAEIATYIYNTWGHTRGRVEVTEVTKAMEGCAR